nr:ATP-binding protein [Stakelama sediminis]
MRQLITLRWLAVAGQLATILFVWLVLGMQLPVAPMLATLTLLIALNLASIARLNLPGRVKNVELLIMLLLDIAALAVLLYFSGGATNPFSSLFLLQVILGAILLDTRSTIIVVLTASLCFAALVFRHLPLILPEEFRFGLFDLYILGSLISFVLVAVLLVIFVTRINRNLRIRDTRLATMREQAAEEDHIVRMGLLASGAAHELGTPLSLVSVVINDWAKMPAFADDPELAEDIREMQGALARCKTILTDILLAAGEARGENPAVTTLSAFLDDVTSEWRAQNSTRTLNLDYVDETADDLDIVSDTALKQVIWNVFDNARDASSGPIGLLVERDRQEIILRVSDEGPGFTETMLENFGRPYQSTKNRAGGGLGLFLVTNVMRKLGGRVDAYNRVEGGATVRLFLPVAALEIEREEKDDG